MPWPETPAAVPRTKSQSGVQVRSAVVMTPASGSKPAALQGSADRQVTQVGPLMLMAIPLRGR
jgi:hypothetical protein